MIYNITKTALKLNILSFKKTTEIKKINFIIYCLPQKNYKIRTILIFSCFIVVEASAGLSILTLISRAL